MSRNILSMQMRSKSMVDERGALMMRLQGAIAIRAMLQRAADVQTGTQAPASKMSKIFPLTGRAKPMHIPVKARPKAGAKPPPAAATMTAARPAPPRQGGTPPPVPPKAPPRPAGPPPRVTIPTPRAPEHPPHPPETTTRQVQNIVLGVGVIVLSAAIGLTFVSRSLSGGGLALMLGLLTVVAIAMPFAMYSRGLITTAEWLVPVGLLLVLVDGEQLWTVTHVLSGPIYAGLVCAVAAGVAVVYQRFTGLAVPRFAAILLIQPIPALLLHPWLHDLVDWAAVLTALAGVDLFIALRSRASQTHGQYLRFAVRRLQETVNLAALVTAAVALSGTHQTLTTLRAGAPLLTAAVVALAAGLLFRTRPLPDISAGVAFAAGIFGFGKMFGRFVPSWGVVATAAAVLLAAFGARTLPAFAERGARWAAAAAAALTGVVIVVRGWSALTAPLRASTPFWSASRSAYETAVARHGSWPIVVAMALVAVAAVVLAPAEWRRDALVAGLALTVILVPGAGQLSWVGAMALTAAVALGLGAFGLTATSTHSSWTNVAATVTAGGYAAWLAAAHPEAQALLLLIFALAGAAIGLAAAGRRDVVPSAVPHRILGQHWDGVPDARAAEAGWGAAALALPGAVAAATAALAPSGHPNAQAVLAASFLAVSGTLTAAAIAQVARRMTSPLLNGGAALGALAVAVAAFRTEGVATADSSIAIVLLLSAGLLCLAPTLNAGTPAIRRAAGPARRLAGMPARPNPGPPRPARLFGLDGDEMAAAAVTAAAIAAFTRVASLIVPGRSLGIMALLVLVVAAGTRAMPEHWRRGQIAGGGVVGAGVAISAGITAVSVAVATVKVNRPVWNVPLADWGRRLNDVGPSAGHAASALIALLLIAAAGRIVLNRPYSRMAGVVCLGLAALVAPAALGTGAWGPTLFSGVMATAAGLLAGVSRDRVTSMTCGAVATVLFASTIASSLTSSASTAGTLAASAAVSGMVATVAAATLAGRGLPGAAMFAHPLDRPAPHDPDAPLVPAGLAHLVVIGGGALGAAIVALAAAAGTLAAVAQQPLPVVRVSALAGLALAIGIVAAAAHRLEPLLAYASGAVSVGGLTIALTAARDFTMAGMLGAIATLLAVFAEVVRATTTDRRPADTRTPAGGFLPRRTSVLLAAGPAGVLALASIGPTILAALIGPYHTFEAVWKGAPADSIAALGPSADLVGSAAGVATAVLLTIAGTLAAVGFGGNREAIVGRIVAVVTPGVAITVLIAPYLLDARWPLGPMAALGVALMCGLSVALTNPPPATDVGRALSAARHFVTGICVVAGASGAAGSLATPSMTLTACATAALGGLVAALYGRAVRARIVGWVVTAAGWQLLVMVTCLRLGVPVYDAAFAVGVVAAAGLFGSAWLPRLRRGANSDETLTVEVTAYAGGALALGLAARSLPHLAVFLAAWGAVLGMVAARQRRSRTYRSILMWTAATHELVAWCLLMTVRNIFLPEAYTLGIALVALVTGWIELRWHPALTSWVSFGVALAAALGPSLAIVIATGETPLRRVLLLIAAAVTVIAGALRRQQAPTIIGGVVLLGAVINEIVRFLNAPSLILVLMALIAAALIGVGANFEARRRHIKAAWSHVNRMQ